MTNNTPLYAEEITIEQVAEEKIAELREKLKVLQEELAEEEEENEELNKLVWKGIEKLNKKGEEEKELNNQINQLTTQINNLTTERNNCPNITHQEYNDLVQERNNIRNQLTTTNNLIANIQNLLGINNLNNLPPLPEGETLNTLLARPTPTQLNNLEREKEQKLTQKDNEITELNKKIRKLEDEKEKLQTDLDREKGWWDKWMDDKKSFYDVKDPSWLDKNVPNGHVYEVIYWNERGGYLSEYYDTKVIKNKGEDWERFGISRYNPCVYPDSVRIGRRFVKCIYEYYKNQ